MAETWMINENPTQGALDETIINFFDFNNTSYNLIGWYPNNISAPGLKYRRTSDGVFNFAYNTKNGANVWLDQAYRTLTFETAPTGDLLTWLEANGERQSEPTAKLTFDLSTLDLGTGTYNVKSLPKGDGVNYRDADLAECVAVAYTKYHLSLESATWAQVKEFSDSGVASSLWSVGDTKSVVINGKIGDGLTLTNQTFYLTILGFDHNIATEGVGYSHSITFGGFKNANGVNITLVDSKYSYVISSSGPSGTYFGMNSNSSNSGGWKNSRMRCYLLGSTTATSPVANSMMAALPSDLRAVMKPVYKYSDNTGGGSDTASYVTRTTDYLPLLAEFEVFGTRSYANSAEKNYQQRYAFYNDGITNTRIRYRHDDPSTAAGWWLRSVYASSNGGNFCCVYSSGGAGNYSAYIGYGVSFALVV